jgi:hypothetical protein
MTITITEAMLKRLAEISSPHMKAINEAVEDAFPDIHPDMTYTAAFGLQLGVLLQSCADGEQRAAVVRLLNQFAAQVGYRLVETSVQGGHA